MQQVRHYGQTKRQAATTNIQQPSSQQATGTWVLGRRLDEDSKSQQPTRRADGGRLAGRRRAPRRQLANWALRSSVADRTALAGRRQGQGRRRGRRIADRRKTKTNLSCRPPSDVMEVERSLGMPGWGLRWAWLRVCQGPPGPPCGSAPV